MSYAIFRSEPVYTINDLAQIGAHNKREKKAYNSNPDINIELSKNNIELVPLTEKYVKGFKILVKDYEKEKKANLALSNLVQQKEILFIIEEPESHLFPKSQKYITELIALVNNCGHSIVLTTHSPYVLGTLNNLLYAKTISPQARKEANKIIRESLWLDYNAFDSWFVKNGTIENCMDADIHMIQNEKIDEISKVINEDFERLLELQTTNEESVVF